MQTNPLSGLHEVVGQLSGPPALLWQGQAEANALLYIAAQAVLGSLEPPANEPKRAAFVRSVALALASFVAQGQLPPPPPEVALYGSSASGLHFAASDLDLTLLLALGVAEQRALVGRLAALFGATPGFEAHAQLPPAVRVPSLRLRHAELGGGHAGQGVTAQLTCGDSLGLANTRLVSCYLQIDDRARGLCMLVKHWAGRRGLASPRDGTPSSYCWVLLALNHLQCLGVLPCLQAPELLAGRTAEHWDRGYGLAPDGRSVAYAFCGNPNEQRHAPAPPPPTHPPVRRRARAVTHSSSAHPLTPSPRSPPSPPLLTRLRYMMAEGRRGELDLVDLLHDYFSVLLAYSATHVFSVGGGTRQERAKRGWFAEQHRLAVEDPMDRERNLGDMVTAATMARINEEARRAQTILHSARQTRPSPIASRQAADDLFADLFAERGSGAGDARGR